MAPMRDPFAIEILAPVEAAQGGEADQGKTLFVCGRGDELFAISHLQQNISPVHAVLHRRIVALTTRTFAITF